MNTKFYKSRLKTAIEDLIGFKIIALVEALIILMLAFFVLTVDTHEKTIVTPPNYNKPFWVKGAEFSPDYIEQMTRHFANYLLTYQRSNASYQFDEVLRFADPSYYATLKAQLSSDVDRITRNELGSVFYLTSVDIKKNDAYIEGELAGSIGQQWLPKKHKTYKISYSTRNGNFYITSFKEVWKSAGGIYEDVKKEDSEMIELESAGIPVVNDVVSDDVSGGHI